MMMMMMCPSPGDVWQIQLLVEPQSNKKLISFFIFTGPIISRIQVERRKEEDMSGVDCLPKKDGQPAAYKVAPFGFFLKKKKKIKSHFLLCFDR